MLGMEPGLIEEILNLVIKIYFKLNIAINNYYNFKSQDFVNLVILDLD